MPSDLEPAAVRRILIDCGMLTVFDLSPDEVYYALWSAAYWAGSDWSGTPTGVSEPVNPKAGSC